MKLSSALCIATIACALSHVPALAQQATQSTTTIAGHDRTEVLDTLIKELNDKYVFADVAQKLEAMLRSRQKAGEYDSIADGRQLADKLTGDLRGASGDKHLHVRFFEKAIPLQDPAAKPDPQEVARAEADGQKFFKRINYGVERVERLPGNIGYIELHGFTPARYSGQAYGAAMTLLNGTDALVIDLRKNHGGDPNAVALLASYFFDERTRLSDIVIREGGADRLQQQSTSDYVSGPRYASGKEVVILTSRNTFSAGEDFTYSMQVLKRARVVGEVTGGGAHPGRMERLHPHFLAFIPFGRSLNPVTKTDWEGVGVSPDVKVGADDALREAQVMLLQKLSQTQAEPTIKQELAKRLAQLQAAPSAAR